MTAPPSAPARLRLSASRRPPVGYAEVPDFHVEVARQSDPALRSGPLLVGGDPNKRGKVIAASSDLREIGIVEGMGMAEALEHVPPGTACVRTDMTRAREISGRLRAAVRREVGAVEVAGLAGFYLRAPESREEVLELAGRLVRRVAEHTGLPLRLGVAPARFAALLAAEDAGRQDAFVVDPGEFEDYLLSISLERLPGVGPKTAARLAELGATDVSGLRRLGIERLEVLLGNRGRSLWLLACGEDPKPLRVKRHPETLSREETLVHSDSPPQDLAGTLTRLAEGLEQALRREGLQAGRIALRLTTPDARTVTRSRSLEMPATTAAVLASEALALLRRVDLADRVVRRAGIVLGGLEISGAEDRQLDLF